MNPGRDAIAGHMTSIVRGAVVASRATHGDLKNAIPDVARRYGLGVRRVTSYWWSRVTFVSAHEHLQILDAYEKDLVLREARQTHALQLTRAERISESSASAKKVLKAVKRSAVP
jgi:hypothetical protein